MSPYRDRPVEENLDLFERMKNGEFPEGSRTLRAKIDLASGNFNMRDPVIYRIRSVSYTHLDVYKRQTVYCAPARMAAEGENARMNTCARSRKSICGSSSSG